jgi:aspartate ammonia-lyase
MAWSLFKSLQHLAAGCRTLADHCVNGITANKELLERRVRASAGLATALNPYLGYENSTRIAQQALATGRGVSELVLEQGLLRPEELTEILQVDVLTRPSRRLVGSQDPRA